MLFVMAAYGESLTTVSFYDSATVSDTAIYLKDIAVVTGEGAGQLARMVVGCSAPPGFSRFITTEDLVTNKFNTIMQHVVFNKNKANSIIVATSCAEKNISEYNDLIHNYIQKNIAWESGQWEFRIDSELKPFKVYSNEPVTIEIKGAIGKYARGPVRLQFIAKQFDKQVTISLACYIKVIAPVLVTQTGISRNSVISLSDCKIEKKNISSLGPEPIFSIAEVLGKKASRSIPDGTILTNQMVLPVPDIMKGDNLSLVVSRRNVTISVAATARENGRIGQKIWVENGATKKLVRVLVTGDNSVTLL